MTRLGELLFDFALPSDVAAVPVHGVCDDSRRVQRGDLFVAIAGLTVDGHRFAPQAVERGAAAVIGSRPLSLSVPTAVVDEPERALGLAASRLFGEPDARMRLVGITGTNGKTTTSYLLEAMLRAARRSPAIVGTVSYRFAGTERAAPFTTPTSVELQRLLAEMADSGSTEAVLEVSSHGLSLGRLWGCRFAVAAFSQLSQDHLDLHGSMEAYLEAKLLLFSQHLQRGGCAVVNVDGDGAGRVVETVERRADVRLLRCSRQRADAELRLEQVQTGLDGLRATLCVGGERRAIQTPLIGDFNGDNLLLAAGCARALGLELAPICAGAAQLSGVPGRLERVDGGAPYAVLVDYSHTPDALARALSVLRPLCSGRLVAVFGCGGDRDRAKRPLMGEAVGRSADLAVVTSDNPRSEDPQAIIADILDGPLARDQPAIDELGAADSGYLVEPDRARAIERAVAALRPGDVLLVAGKGHEDYQILGDRRIHFDDREQVRAALARRRSGAAARIPTEGGG